MRSLEKGKRRFLLIFKTNCRNRVWACERAKLTWKDSIRIYTSESRGLLAARLSGCLFPTCRLFSMDCTMGLQERLEIEWETRRDFCQFAVLWRGIASVVGNRQSLTQIFLSYTLYRTKALSYQEKGSRHCCPERGWKPIETEERVKEKKFQSFQRSKIPH